MAKSKKTKKTKKFRSIVYRPRNPTHGAALRESLLRKAQYRCQICGIEFPHLELAHMSPRSTGTPADGGNLMVLCPNCHRQLDGSRFREAEFIDFLVSALSASSGFRNVQRDPQLSDPRYRPDIIADSHLNGEWHKVVIEVKVAPVLYADRVDGAIAQLKKYREMSGATHAILAIPGILMPEDAQRIQQSGIEIWDGPFLTKKFSGHIAKKGNVSLWNFALKSEKSSTQTAEEAILDRLTKCRPGVEDWSVYQTLIKDACELLFCPPLEAPRLEERDVTGTNRRDIIIPNYATSGFWRNAREVYDAHYVVVDAKNYSAGIGKSEILQIANYLKPHGVGLFALIVTRHGIDSGGKVTIREQWSAHQKMILVLTDQDIRAMLKSRLARSEPEKVLTDLIMAFRISL